jgi:hypothetical protein
MQLYGDDTRAALGATLRRAVTRARYRGRSLYPPARAVPVGAGAYKKGRDDRRMADAHHRVAGFLADFRTRAIAAGARAETVEELGDPAERILWQAQRTDVVILGRETHFNFETPERRDTTLAQVARTSRRPMVVVPETLPEGAGVLVAYGGGRDAARTLQLFVLLGLAAGQTLARRGPARGGAEPPTSPPRARGASRSSATRPLRDVGDPRRTPGMSGADVHRRVTPCERGAGITPPARIRWPGALKP